MDLEKNMRTNANKKHKYHCSVRVKKINIDHC